MVLAWSGFSRLTFVLFIGLVAMGCVSERLGPAPTTLGQEIERLTEAPTRIVWVQDIGDQRDFLSHGTDLRLMGLDSREEGGARVLLDTPRSKAKPMFTANGDWVVFSDRHEERMYAINWDGERILDLGPGFAMATWRDPGTGTEWLYFAREPREHGMPTHNTLWRYPLMDSGEQHPREYSTALEAREELVWDQTPVSEDSFQISADGRFASAAFPWPHVGVLDFETGRWDRLARGCWVAMSPDNENLFWVFDSPHRNVSMFRHGSDEQWVVNVNNAPGVDDHEVYHPRWSNHPDIVTVTGPYREGGGTRRITRGGKAVKVHLGRLNDARTEVTDWVVVTDDTHADFYPDVWVRTSAAPRRAETRATEDAATPGATTWPVAADDLRYVWENAVGLSETFDPETRTQRLFQPEPQLRARFDRHHGMLLDGGFFRDDNAGDLIAEQGPVDAFTIELMVMPTGPQPDGETWVFAVQRDAQALLVLSENAGEWRLRTGDREITLGRVTRNRPTHLTLSLSPERLQVFVNGQQSVSEPLGVALEWPGAGFLFGGDADGGQDWSGTLDHFAMYARNLQPAEIRSNVQLARSVHEARSAPEPIAVRARVTQVSGIPTPEEMAPYRRALVVNEYEVLEVISGELTGDQFLAAHWAILDATLLEAAERPLGSEHILMLEPFEQRTELEGERLAQDTDNFLLDLYFDTNLQ